MGFCFITGGARSGKSRYAESMAMSYENVTYIATASSIDEEMTKRIAMHKSRRPGHWGTVEAYRDLGAVVQGLRGAAILDCLTVMITNIMMETPLCADMLAFDWDKLTQAQADELERCVMIEMDGLLAGLKKTGATVFVVSNELGMGLVPPYPLGRAFRDIAGRVNAMFAKEAHEAVFMVAGLPLKLK